MVHILAKEYLKYDGHDAEPFYIVLSGSGGTGKHHLVEVLHNPKSKHCFITAKTQKNQEFFYLDLEK